MVENTALLRMQDGQPLEAVIMAGLAHAQVVHTIAHLMVRAPSSLTSPWLRAVLRCLLFSCHAARVPAKLVPPCTSALAHAAPCIMPQENPGSAQKHFRATRHHIHQAQAAQHSAGNAMQKP